MDPTSCAPIAIACEQGMTLFLEPPIGWVVAGPVAPARFYVVDPTYPGPIKPSINVLVQPLGRLTPEEYLTLSRLQVKAMGDQANIERDEPIGSSHPARRGSPAPAVGPTARSPSDGAEEETSGRDVGEVGRPAPSGGPAPSAVAAPSAAHIFEALFTAGPEAVRSRQLILIHNGFAHVVTAMTPAVHFHAYRPILEKALDSVALSISTP